MGTHRGLVRVVKQPPLPRQPRLAFNGAARDDKEPPALNNKQHCCRTWPTWAEFGGLRAQHCCRTLGRPIFDCVWVCVRAKPARLRVRETGRHPHPAPRLGARSSRGPARLRAIGGDFEELRLLEGRGDVRRRRDAEGGERGELRELGEGRPAVGVHARAEVEVVAEVLRREVPLRGLLYIQRVGLLLLLGGRSVRRCGARRAARSSSRKRFRTRSPIRSSLIMTSIADKIKLPSVSLRSLPIHKSFRYGGTHKPPRCRSAYAPLASHAAGLPVRSRDLGN